MGQAIIATSVNKRCLSLLVCALVVATAWAQEPTQTRVQELIEQLKSSDREVREDAAKSLGIIGAEAKAAVPALIDALREENNSVCLFAALALGRIGPEAVPALIEALKEENEVVRQTAAQVLGNIGPDAKSAVPALIEALENENDDILFGAAWALGRIGPGAKAAVPGLIDALKGENDHLRWQAAEALGNIGAEAVPALIEALLMDKKSTVRGQAAVALWKIGPEAKAAVPALIEALHDDIASVRWRAAAALGNIGPEAKAAMLALSDALKDENEVVRRNATVAIGNIGPEGVRALIEALKDEVEFVRRTAAKALGEIGPEAKAAVPTLIEGLKDEDEDFCRTAAEALGNIGPEGVSALIDALKNESAFVRETAASALGRIGADAKSAVRALIEALKDENWDVRIRAGVALGSIGADAGHALLALVAVLEKDKKEGRHPLPCEALGRIAQGLQGADRTAFIPDLKLAREAMARARCTDDQIRTVDLAYTHLKVIDEKRWYKILLREAVKEYPWISGVAIVEVGLFGFWGIMLCFSPLTLLMINEALDALFNETMKIKYKGFEGSALPKFLLLVGFFHYQRRVLDAWVDKHIDTARKRFGAMPTVELRDLHIPVPLKIDGELIAQPEPVDCRKTFSKRRFWVLVWGEGGSGKTSLACQLAKWAASDDPSERLTDHRMLAVLIEHDIDIKVDGDRHPLIEAVRTQVKQLLDETEPPSARLVEHLLKQRRILVIIDHISEMSTKSRKLIRPGYDPKLNINAAIVTSRLHEQLQGAVTATVEPQRIDRDHLSGFMTAFVNHHNASQSDESKKAVFKDEDFLDACRQLSRMTETSGITPLLARLFAEQLIAAKVDDFLNKPPENVPDLILVSLQRLNRYRQAKDPDDRTVIKMMKAIAWECLIATFRPGSSSWRAIENALSDEDNLEAKLNYLVDKLGVVRYADAAKQRVQITLDPVAEYLAGLHLVERYRDSEKHWREFFSRADSQPGAPESIKGFLLAVRDCCLAKKKEGDWDIPDFVVKELDKRAGLDPEVLRRARLQQRVQRLITNLNVPEVEDRRAAAKALGKIGPEAKATVPALIEALKDEDDDVCWAAATALGNIGPDAKAAVPALSEALKDERSAVHWPAAIALGLIGPDAKAAVPALIEALKDESELVRRNAAVALGNIGPDAKGAVPALIEALKDANARSRRQAAAALGSIGLAAKPAVLALSDAMKDENDDVRWLAAKALGKIGPDAKAIVPALIEALKDENDVVRWQAAKALGNIGPEAKAGVPTLIEVLKDKSSTVRRQTAKALGRIGPEAKAAVPALSEALKDKSRTLRRRAAVALEKIGPDAKAAVP